MMAHSDFDLMDHTTDLAVEVGPDGLIHSTSRSARGLLESDGSVLEGVLWRELVHPEDAGLVGSPASATVGTRFRLADGTGLWRWFELVAAPALSADEGYGWIVICRDATRQLESERLAALLQRVTSLANRLAEDLDTAVATTARDIASTMGWSVVGTWTRSSHPGGALPPDDVTWPAHADAFACDVLETGRPDWRTVTPTDGDRPAVMHVALPVLTDDGPVAVLVFASAPQAISDELLAVMANVGWQLGMVASRQADRRELDRREQELRRSNAELERFAYVASHDLQEPLRKVVTACELLERRVGGELAGSDGDRYVAIAVDAARRMQTLIRDLLAYSRIGRTAEEPTAIDLGRLVEEVLESVSETVADTHAHVEVGPLPIVHAREPELRQVLTNLVSNALKFHGDSPPRVAIDATSGSGEVEVTVTDHGIGVDPRYAEQIFDVFRRLHRQDEYPGTGIGLAIAKRIVQQHGGRIWITAPAGGGTRFHFTLPTPVES